MFVFVCVYVLSFSCALVFLLHMCLCPCLAPFHKHLVDLVIFSIVFTSPARHLSVLLVKSLTQAHACITQQHQKHIKGGVTPDWKQWNTAITFTYMLHYFHPIFSSPLLWKEYLDMIQGDSLKDLKRRRHCLHQSSFTRPCFCSQLHTLFLNVSVKHTVPSSERKL